MRLSWDSLRQRDPDFTSDHGCQLVRLYDIVRVAHAPKLFRVAQIFRGDIVKPVALHHAVFEKQLETIGGGHKAALYVHDCLFFRRFQRSRFNWMITASSGKRDQLRDVLKNACSRVAHGTPPIPNAASAGPWLLAANCSFCCW